MVRIICVHGTNAGDPSDEGTRWWQRGSPFQRRLCDWIGIDPARFEPFHWGDGPNSELERRKAGEALLKRLRELEAAGEDYVLLGHSHGGSVIHHALLAASSKGQKLQHMRRWITIGTPFLWMRPHRLLFRRLTNTAKIAYVYTIFGTVGILTYIPIYYYYGRDMTRASAIAMGQPPPPNETIDLQLASFIFFAPFIGALLMALVFWSQRRIRKFYSKKGRAFFKREFLPRWEPFWSRSDEAINALRATGPMRLTLFNRKILTEPAKTAIVLGITVLMMVTFFANMFYLAKFGISPDYVVHSYALTQKYSVFGLFGMPEPDLTAIKENPVDVQGVVNFARQHPYVIVAVLPIIMLEVALIFFLLWVAFWIIHWLAYLLGIPAAMFLNRLTADRLRNAAFGNDTLGERVVQVAPMPQDCEESFPHLPDEIETHLSAFCAERAAVALQRIRDVLGVDQQVAANGDIAETLAKEVSSHQLIHVAYFEVEEFALLVAGALRADCTRPATPPRQDLVGAV